jgi:hypothetical protein
MTRHVVLPSTPEAVSAAVQFAEDVAHPIALGRGR